MSQSEKTDNENVSIYEKYKRGELSQPSPENFNHAFFRILLTNPDNYFGPYHEWFERPTYYENNDIGEIKVSTRFKTKQLVKKVKTTLFHR